MRPRTVFILFKITFLTLKFALIQTRSSPLKFLCLMFENAPLFFSHFFCFFCFSLSCSRGDLVGDLRSGLCSMCGSLCSTGVCVGLGGRGSDLHRLNFRKAVAILNKHVHIS